MSDSIVIVGGGQAAIACVTKLRNLDFSGDITIVTEEAVLPYQRPPLSKQYLLGKQTLEDLFFQADSWYDERSITVLLEAKVVAVNRDTPSVVTEDGREISYSKLVWCAGSEPIRLPASVGGEAENVSVVRDLPHVDHIKPLLEENGNVLVVGGGYIGLEAAAVCRAFGCNVTLVEAQSRILQRVAAEATSDYFRQLHQQNGVEIREDTTLQSLVIEGSKAVSAQFSDGSSMAVAAVIVGIGIRPNIRALEEAGVDISNGVAVNEFCQTSDPNIYAAGDCCSFIRNGEQIRLESVQNANDQGETAANHIMGNAVSYQSTPWFWSDQYDVKLQIAGLNNGYTKTVSRTGSKPGAVSHWYFDDEKLLAVDAINEPGAFMVTKRLLDLGKTPTPEDIENTDKDLKVLMKELTRPS
ncbi:MAG: FAD-dependent oxidoreductase [Pseudomonadota bacterium]